MNQQLIGRCGAAVVIVAAICCVRAASAESGVTIYGVADVNVEYVGNFSSVTPTAANGFRLGDGNHLVRSNSGGLAGSRFGLRGTEDLGNGLSAIFVLEGGIGIDTGSSQQGGRLFGRQAFVGLDSRPVGRVSFGRQYTSIFDAFAAFSPTRYAPQYEPVWQQLGLNLRSDNTVKYVGKFAGVTATAHWSFGNGIAGTGEVPGQARRDSAYGAALSYAGGAFGMAAAYDQYNPTLNATTGATGTIKKAGIAASYAIGDVKLMGGYRWGQTRDAAGRTTMRDDYYWVGTNYQVLPALSLALAYYYDDVKLHNGTNPGNPWQLTFVADYSLSKRTDIYLTTAYSKRSPLNFDSASVNYVNGYYLGTSKDSMFGAAVGIRHRF